MSKPLLILDFDGVINMLGTSGDIRRAEGLFGYIERTEVYCHGVAFPVRYSRELVRKLNEVVRETSAEWLWLTTWNACSVESVNPEIGTQATDWIRWNSAPGDDPALSKEERSALHAAAKGEAVQEFVNANPRPFIWVDDEAGKDLRTESFPQLEPGECNVIHPDPHVGLTIEQYGLIAQALGSSGE